MSSAVATPNGDIPDSVAHESPYVRELQRNIRSITKKLAAMQKTDAVIAANQGVSLDDLVAQRKINADQKASALKKPGLQAQLVQLDEQVQHYRKFDAEHQEQLAKQKEELTTSHNEALEKARQEATAGVTQTGEGELRKKLLVFSQFLRAAAAKRNTEDETETDENRAFEGALLLVYGGDDKAVDAMVSIIDGSEEQVSSIESSPLPVKYSQIKQASIEHAPFQTEENWVDQVAEANAGAPATSDPTIANASLTEIAQGTNGAADDTTQAHGSSVQATSGDGAGNTAGERWDPEAAGGMEKLEDSYEIVPRPNDEVDNPVETAPPTYSASATTPQLQGTSWADEPVPEPSSTTSAKEAAATATATPAAADDGFHEVAGRHRGRGGRGGRGDGEFRGRGGHGRGRGGHGGHGGRGGRGEHGEHARGEHGGRGGRGEHGEHGGRGGRGPRGDGEFRGRGGRGRGGPRGDGPRGDGPRGDGPRGDGPRGDHPPRS